MINLVVAYAQNRVIGKNNDLPWYLPADLKRFRQLTTGQTVIMGRKTYESILKRLGKPLPKRQNIVLSRSQQSYDGSVVAVGSLGEAIAAAKGDELFIIGGESLFRESLDMADRIYATEIQADVDGDVYFPRVDASQWRVSTSEPHLADDRNPYAYSYVTYERVKQ